MSISTNAGDHPRRARRITKEVSAGARGAIVSVWSSDYYHGSGRPMTEQWQTLPANLAVHCPRCGARALFDEPFGYAHVSQGVPDDARPPVQQRGGWYVWEKYPAVLGLPP